MEIKKENLWAVILAVLFIAAAGLQYSTTRRAVDQNWRNQITSCKINNGLRKESNARVKSHRAEERGLLLFLNAATEARALGHTQADRRAVRNYIDIEQMIREQVVFNLVPLVDCKKEFPHP